MHDNPDDERLIQKYERDKSGGQLIHINNSKYPIRGNPKFLALKALKPIKSIFDRIITGRLAGLIPYSVENNRYSEPIQEMARVFDLLIEAEKMSSMKKKWQAYKKVICAFMEHDIAYRYRIQWFLERLNMKHIRLTEGDKYYMRVKNFRVDLENEWKEVLKKYPQLKGREQEFKQFLEVDRNWNIVDEDHYKTLEELAPKFLNNEKTT